MKENIDSQEIESYLRNKMSTYEKSNFEARMATDYTLLKAVDESLLIVKGIRYTANNDIRHRAEAARDTFHRKEWYPKLGFNWWIIVGFFIFAGLLLLGYLYFENSQLTKTDKIIQEKPNPIMATQSNTNKDDSLGMTAGIPLFSQIVQIVNADKYANGESIQVNIYRDQALKQTHFLYQDALLNFYLPEGIDFPLPPLLIKQGNSYLLIISKEEYPLIKSETLQILKHN